MVKEQTAKMTLQEPIVSMEKELFLAQTSTQPQKHIAAVQASLYQLKQLIKNQKGE